MASGPGLPTEDEPVSLGIDDLHISLQGNSDSVPTCVSCGALVLAYSHIVSLSVSLMEPFRVLPKCFIAVSVL